MYSSPVARGTSLDFQCIHDEASNNHDPTVRKLRVCQRNTLVVVQMAVSSQEKSLFGRKERIVRRNLIV